MRPASRSGQHPFLDTDLHRTGHLFEWREWFFRETLNQIIGDRLDLIRRQCSARVDHHVDNVVPARGVVTAVHNAAKFVAGGTDLSNHALFRPRRQFVGVGVGARGGLQWNGRDRDGGCENQLLHIYIPSRMSGGGEFS